MLLKNALTALALTGMMAGGSALAASNVDAGGGNGVATVSIDADLAATLATELSEDTGEAIDVADLPESVEMPITLAAAACDKDVSDLASGNEQGEKSCDAAVASDELKQLVLQDLEAE